MAHKKRHRLSVRLLSCEEIEARLCLSGVSFTPHDINVGEVDGPTSLFAADLDGDGDADVLSGSSEGDRIFWYENTDGKGDLGPQKVISTAAHGPLSVYAVDVDSDGDTDVLSATSSDDKIAWYENIDGKGTFGDQTVITTSADGAQSLFAADLDGDGDIDVLSASSSDDKIAWYENIDGKGMFGDQTVITTSADGAQSLFAADLDGDGDMDVLSVSQSGNTISWHENSDGKGSFGPQQVIIAAAQGARSVYAADVDGDGDMDVLTAVAWYENIDGKGTFTEQRISSTDDARQSVFAADFDGDGDVDAISNSTDGHANKIGWFENTDGDGSFVEKQIIGGRLDWGGHWSLYATDVDGDGDVDVLSAHSYLDIIAWYENTDGKGDFSEAKTISLVGGADSVYTADLDGGGDVDVISANSHNKLGWYENIDGRGSFDEPKVVATDSARSVHAADFDGDGDMDVLSVSSASSRDDKLAWYENTDGKGSFGEQNVIAADTAASSIYAADMDGDGDVDVLLASWRDGISWYENADGKGSFGTKKATTKKTDTVSVYAADLDGDGDIDVLSADGSPDKVFWHENTDGKGALGPQRVISRAANQPSSVYAADVDGDGDVDVLSASHGDNKIAWYENTDGKGTFSLIKQNVISTAARYANSVYAADLDGDGDTDVLSASAFDDKTAWYENIDGKGSFGEQQVITTAVVRVGSVNAADIDNDGDLDVLSASWSWSPEGRIAWHENLSPRFAAGDANRDSQFDQQDIVQVLQAAKYLSGEPAKFDEGDWNGDDVFDSLDIVAAMQTGNYLQGPYVADTHFAEIGR